MGIRLDDQGRRHELWLNPTNGRRAPIPRYNQQEVPIGTLHDILQQLGIARADLERA